MIKVATLYRLRIVLRHAYWKIESVSEACRHRPIMPKILPIMLLSIAQKLSLLCSKLCFQNQDYALELTVLLEHISLT